jgi:hypothetical protein
MVGEYVPNLRIVDVAAHARACFGAEAVAELAAAVGGVPMEHDYRFEIDTPGGETTFGRYATAEHVAAHIERLKTEGVRNGR